MRAHLDQQEMTDEIDPGTVIVGLCANPDATIVMDGEDLDPAWFARLVQLSCVTRTAPLLHRALAVRHAGAVSKDFAILAEARETSMRYALIQARSLMMAAAHLDGAGHPFILLKGFGVAFTHYPEPGLRPMRDIDLLFARQQAEDARDLLLRSGLREIPNAGHYGVEHLHQLPEIEDPRHGVIYEIHHRANRHATPKLDALQAFIEETAQDLSLFGRNFRVPSDEANLLHLVAHATVHHLFANGPLVLADLHYLARKRQLDWQIITARARDFGLEKSLQLLCEVARSQGAQWVPDEVSGAGAIPSGFGEAASQTMLLDEEGTREIDMLRRQGDTPDHKISAGRLFLKAFSPDPMVLAKLANTTAQSPFRYLAYPRWVLSRMRRYFAIRHSDGRTARELEDWLKADGL